MIIEQAELHLRNHVQIRSSKPATQEEWEDFEKADGANPEVSQVEESEWREDAEEVHEYPEPEGDKEEPKTELLKRIGRWYLNNNINHVLEKSLNC